MLSKTIIKLLIVIIGLIFAISTQQVEYIGLAALLLILIEAFYWYKKKRNPSV